MHTQIAHTTIFPVDGLNAFPVDFFPGIEIAAVQQAGAYFDNSAESPFINRPDDPLRAGEKWKFRGAGNDDISGLRYGREDRLICLQIDTKGLFAEQVLSCTNDVHIHPLVKIMRDGAVYSVYIGAVQQIVIIRRLQRDGRYILLKPIEQKFVCITDAHNLRSKIQTAQVTPARRGRCKFPPHQAETNHPKSNDPL